MPSTIGVDGVSYQTTRNNVRYAEYPTPSRQWANEGCLLTRRLGCLLADEEQFVMDMLGEDTYTSGERRFNRYLPQADTEWADFYVEAMTNPEFLGQFRGSTEGDWATFVDTSAATPTDGIVVYDVTFKSPLYYVISDEELDDEEWREIERFSILQGQDTVESLPMPLGSLNFLPIVPGSKVNPVGAPYSLLFPQESIVIRWIRIPPAGYPKETISAMLGKINSVAFTTPGDSGKTYAPETLLLMAPNKRQYQGNNGQTYLDVDIIMQARVEHGWNKFPTENGVFRGTWRRHDSENGAYLKDDFNKLFDPSNG